MIPQSPADKTPGFLLRLAGNGTGVDDKDIRFSGRERRAGV
jgi:hypothetical protein